MGYASAIAVSLLMITLLSSIPLFKIMKKNENELS